MVLDNHSSWAQGIENTAIINVATLPSPDTTKQNLVVLLWPKTPQNVTERLIIGDVIPKKLRAYCALARPRPPIALVGVRAHKLAYLIPSVDSAIIFDKHQPQRGLLSSVFSVIPVRDLQPGDAMNEIPYVRHIIIFMKWNDVTEKTKNIRTAQFMHEPSCDSKKPFAYNFTTNVIISKDGMSATLPPYFKAAYRAIRSTACGTPDQTAASTAVSANVQLNAGVGPAALVAKLYPMASNIGSALNQDLVPLVRNGASQRRKLLQVLSPNVTVLPSCSAGANVSATPQTAGSLVYGGTNIKFDVSCNASGFEQVSVNSDTNGTITAPLNATLTLPYTLVFVDDSDAPTSPAALAAYMRTIIQTAFANPALHLPSFSAFARNVSGAQLFLDTLGATTPTTLSNVSLVYPVITGNVSSTSSSTSTSSEYSAPSPSPNASKGLWGIKQLTPFIAEVVGGGIGFCLLLCICLQIRRCGGRKGGGAHWWRVPAVIPSTG